MLTTTTKLVVVGSMLLWRCLLSSCTTSVLAFSVGNRRQFWNQLVGGGISAACVVTTTWTETPQPAQAATTTKPAKDSASSSDKAKIVKGYQRLTYLLDNWDKETTVCGRGDNPYVGCERTPMKVMDYLGYRDTNDPLFKVERTLMRLQAFVPDGFDTEYQDAMEKVVEKADEGSGLAYVSSWGEANPGGGKDRVELFIERSKNDVIEVRDSLATIMKVLDLKP